MAWNNTNPSFYDTPMQTGSPTNRQDSFGYPSFHTPYKAEQSFSQFNQSQKQFDNRYLSPHAVEQQLALILSQPSISQKCSDITNFIKERFACNMSRNILSQFKPIIENIFGYNAAASHDLATSEANRQGRTEGWMLKTLTRSTNANDYDSVISFLHPEGVLFALVRSLTSETSFKFEFPVSQFPPYFRSMIENGTAPPFFSNKIISTSYSSISHLILNPFEFYIFHFGLYILNSTTTSIDAPNSPANEPAYFTLLRMYLNHFVPVDNGVITNEISNINNPTGQSGSIWQSLSLTTSSILNLATNNNNQNSSNSQENQIMPCLFKASIFQPHAPYNQNMSSHQMMTPGLLLYGQGEHLGSIEWRCSTFLLMITELWFGNIPAPKTNYILRSTTVNSDFSVTNIQPYSANIDQMTAVRIMIKHLHSFSNSFTYNPVSHASCHGLAEVKQTIWTSKYPLQKRLYTFIKVAFNRWPMDYTFRQPLEAWLSYIQPWRYVRLNNSCGNDFEELDNNRNMTLTDVPSIDNHWKNFISDNLLYYSVLFSLLVDRLLQLDLSSSRNALMLFRAIKVYSQPDFLTLLRDAEENVFKNNYDQTINMSSNKSPYKISTPNRTSDVNTSKAKLLAPSFLANGKVSTPRARFGALEHHLMSLESDSDFTYVSLFSPQVKQQLAKLLITVQKSRISISEFVQNVEARSRIRNKGWIDSILSFVSMEDTSFESKDEREMYKDKLLAEDYLKFASTRISQSFEISMPEISLRDIKTSANTTTSSEQKPKIFFNY